MRIKHQSLVFLSIWGVEVACLGAYVTVSKPTGLHHLFFSAALATNAHRIEDKPGGDGIWFSVNPAKAIS